MMKNERVQEMHQISIPKGAVKCKKYKRNNRSKISIILKLKKYIIIIFIYFSIFDYRIPHPRKSQNNSGGGTLTSLLRKFIRPHHAGMGGINHHQQKNKNGDDSGRNRCRTNSGKF